MQVSHLFRFIVLFMFVLATLEISHEGIEANTSERVTASSQQPSPLVAFSNDRIYVIDIETLEIYNLTDESVGGKNPSWSPSGDKIVFERDFDGSPQIAVIEISTGEFRQLTDEGTNIAPAWSPDGESISFASWTEENPLMLDVYVLDFDLNEQEFLMEAWEGSFAKPVWSPDSSYILFAGPAEIPGEKLYLINIETQERIDLTGNLDFPTQCQGIVQYRNLAWSHTSNQIAALVCNDIYIFQLDESFTSVVYYENLTDGYHEETGLYGDLSWSPDGTQLVGDSGNGLTIIDVDTSIVTGAPVFRRIILNHLHRGLSWSYMADPAWRPCVLETCSSFP